MPPPVVTLRQLNRATLARQGLLAPLGPAPVARQVERLGALQSQHPDWPPFALQTRLAEASKPVDLGRARARKSVVRAPLMRMTVHLVSADDFWPLSTLTHPFRASQFRAIFKLDPVSSPLGRRITAAHGAVLAVMHETPLAIREIEAILAGELVGVTIPPNRALWRHFSSAVPLIQVPYAGETYGRARYVPARSWLPGPSSQDMDPERAAAQLAARYLAAFGPANGDDLGAYVGRGRDPRRWRTALAALGEQLVVLRSEDGRELVDLAQAPRPPEDTDAPPRLLARWDSLLLAYGTRDRSRVLPPEHQASVITRNADVLPTFLVDGFVAGTWLPRMSVDGAPDVELRPFGRLSTADRRALEAEAWRLLPILRSGAFARYPGTD
ncbi:MAG: winged helix DNA-binding domain-containing protein [Chloroflexota bacterium]|nr:winged helix DNA-binding domain-containing protein [Chloroflexota bacterium]